MSVDVNNLGFTGCQDSANQVLTGFDDWQNLKFRAAFSPDAGFSPPESDELTFESATIIKQQFLATLQADPSIDESAAPPTTVLTGHDITYTLAVENNRAVQAEDVMVTDNLPSETTFVSCNSTGGGVCGGAGNNRIVSFTELPGNSSATIDLVANVTCSVPDATVIANEAIIDSVTPDFEPDNNSSSVSITASNPPPVISNVAVDADTLWPPNHKMRDVMVSYQVTDNCGVPTVELSVASDEPTDGPGDGNTSPDWEVVDANHVRLRAERAGEGDGRVYTITITTSDSGGGSSSQEITVTVPHSQGN